MFNFFKKKNGDRDKKFDILNTDTWKFASETRPIKWNGNPLPRQDNNGSITEKDAVVLFSAIFEFLEQNGAITPSDKKIKAITTILNRMETPEKAAKLQKRLDEEYDNSIPDGLFNPRDPATYKYAKINKSLVIDGVQIFRIYENAVGKEVKENETEENFVSQLPISLQFYARGIIWGKAVDLIKAEFIKQGINEPGDYTPGYLDRIEELYQSMLKNGMENPTQKKELIAGYIKRRVAECAPEKPIRYGGYGFSEAQMEALGSLPVEKIEKIGKILASGKGKGSSKLQQEIFNSLGVDGYYIVRLDGMSKFPDMEENIMHDYYLGFEDFESEEDIRNFFNTRPYLEKRSELKERVVQIQIDRL